MTVTVPIPIASLAQLREARGLTQREVAEAVGVSQQTISTFELGALANPETTRRIVYSLPTLYDVPEAKVRALLPVEYRVATRREP